MLESGSKLRVTMKHLRFTVVVGLDHERTDHGCVAIIHFVIMHFFRRGVNHLERQMYESRIIAVKDHGVSLIQKWGYLDPGHIQHGPSMFDGGIVDTNV